ncbi:tat pathway signal sequence [Colletotrichum plurivorum]|uniref:Tat pathway signal sequence n=1 Tax=Colletotrichum plurivorum TaxID=2175906 RepID=A0A8H6JR57_9PEZI|nr:tat pathway signal sequence [Colletotrichum plurivorum]
MGRGQGKNDPGQLKVKPEAILKAEPEADVKIEKDDISPAQALHAQIDLSLVESAINEKSTPALKEAVSFNYDEDKVMPYKAEVEFIAPSDWAHEIKTLLKDITDDEPSKDMEAEEDAKSALERIVAVYPRIPPQIIPKMSVDDLLADDDVQKVLGRTIILKNASSKGLYKQIQGCIESKAKGSSTEMAHWPLIKMVRVFTKAAALSTGAVLVDLPGLQDSNAAREAVATQYHKNCSALWIVTPINRAVDDKSASELMGDSFRRQMMLDGLHTAVTVICSKTDEIRVEEAISSLSLSETLAHDVEKVRCLGEEIQSLEAKIRDLKRQKSKLKVESRKTHDDLNAFGAALERIHNGQTAEESLSKLGKRKFAAVGGVDVSEITLTKEQIEGHIDSLRDQARRLDEKIKLLGDEIEEDGDDKLTSLQDDKRELFEVVKRSCIRERNAASVASIRRRFADCIREIDVSNSMKENEDAFDPDQLDKDYRRVGENLPVFCVSSHVYQRMNGQMAIEDFTTFGFRDRYDTGITDLQAHAGNLAESSQVAQYREILSNLVVLLSSISYWVTGRDIELAGQDTKSITRFLEDLAGRLAKRLNRSTERCSQKLDAALDSEIIVKLDRLVEVAVHEAINICENWFLPPTDGGLNPNIFSALEQKYEKSRPLRAALELLRHQIKGLINRVWVFSRTIKDFISESQRKANRAFVPPIERAMLPVWIECSKLTGRGCTRAKRQVVIRKLKSTGNLMFRYSVNETTGRLRLMQSTVNEKLKAGVEEIYKELMDVTSSVFMVATENQRPSDDEIRLRDALKAILLTIPDRFGKGPLSAATA